MFAEDEARLLLSENRPPGQLAQMVERRISGVPLEHVVGWVEFCGRRYAVDPGVFVPRRKTEFLVERAVAAFGGSPNPSAGALSQSARQKPAVVVDLCCGSGVIGAAVGARLTETMPELGIEVHAADVDPAAVRCAARNLAAIGGSAHCGDLYDALPVRLCGRVDLLVVNAPYVPTDSIRFMPPEARLFEPVATLDGGSDGLAVQRRIAAQAGKWLGPGGLLYIESSERQGAGTQSLLEAAGLSTKVEHSEELDATIVGGRNRG